MGVNIILLHTLKGQVPKQLMIGGKAVTTKRLMKTLKECPLILIRGEKLRYHFTY